MEQLPLQPKKPIFGADGKQLNAMPPGLVVLKRDQNTKPLSSEFIQQISQVTHANVIVLPMEYELMMGRLAVEEIQAVHNAIHMILAGGPEDGKEVKERK
jgi:hypothetical protein